MLGAVGGRGQRHADHRARADLQHHVLHQQHPAPHGRVAIVVFFPVFINTLRGLSQVARSIAS